MTFELPKPFGFYNIHKPVGPTSHDVVAQVRPLVGRRVKVGHTGTLDPFASGVLVIAVGPATRLADLIQSTAKCYVAEVTLGAASTTDDIEGDITPAPAAPEPTDQQVRQALEPFVGAIMQGPPAYSAVHVEGRRAYKLARSGQRVEPAAREVTIHRLELLRYEYPRAELDVLCGAGTYIRSIARDLGRALCVGGYCSALVRRAVGAFGLADAVDPDALDIDADLVAPVTATVGLERFEISGEDVPDLVHGKLLRVDRLRRLDSAPTDHPQAQHDVAIVDGRGNLVALGERREGAEMIQPRRVFLGPSPA
ncbi:hypothetical protein LCGC14_0094720 [marine sediment metagenome]|uniref:tRNA pseudouridine(55) synthase n=1 Tax=marine sediment metagenome TaxID=412755 RepID=A0A0F9XVZ0_9ZZZZ|nr:tRNA pseudouridine(55) synthase TruB [Phycisphaerae bacterium]HDZ45247.1 tRNA pseudouridine(55) synthase TruB [Phycisphaerae bacterium]